MVETVAAQTTTTGTSAREHYVQAYRWMLLARVLDDKFASLYRAGKINGGVFLGRGQEALSVALAVHLRRGDVYAPLIRDQAGRLAFGEPILDSTRTYFGSPLGPMRSRDGNVHRGRPLEGLLPMISHLGAMISVVNGALMGKRFKGEKGFVGASCLGDGATSTGSFHEAINQAAVEKLPLVLVIANNQYAYSTPTSRQFACDSLAAKAAGYGVRAHEVDGTDFAACMQLFNDVVERARRGEGPQLVVAELLRLCGHGEHDDAHYVDTTLRQAPMGRDCMKVAEDYLASQQWATSADFAAWRSSAIHDAEHALATAQREGGPDPFTHDWCALSTRRLLDTQPEA